MNKQLNIQFDNRILIWKLMKNNQLTEREIFDKAAAENLDGHFVFTLLRYMKNIRGKFDEETYSRANIHFKKLTDRTLRRYWEFTKDLNYEL